MEYYKTSKLLDDSSVSKSVKRKWIGVNDLSGGKYSVNKNRRFKAPVLRSDLCDYSDAYIVVKERISVASAENTNRRNTGELNAEDLDVAMSIYNLLEYSDNCFMTSGTWWNYQRDEVNEDANENSDAGNYRINNNKTTKSKYFGYKTTIIGKPCLSFLKF